MECSICRHTYNNDKRIPRILTTCGHTYCEICLISIHKKDMIPCIECSKYTQCKSIKALPINHSLMQLPSNMISSITCNTHNKPIEAYCNTNTSLLCVDCILSKQYKDKDISSIDEGYKISLDAYTKDMKLCEQIVNRCRDLREDNKTLDIDKYKLVDMNKINDLYDNCRNILNSCMSVSYSNIENEYNNRHSEINQHIENINSIIHSNDILIQDKHCDKISFLKNIKQRKDLINTIKKMNQVIPITITCDTTAFSMKKEIEYIISSIRSSFNESTRPSVSTNVKMTPNNNSKGTNKQSSNNNIRPQTSIKKTKEKETNVKTNNLNNKRNEMKIKKQNNNIVTDTQMKHNNRDISHLTVKLLDDQKISMISESIINTDNMKIDRPKTSWEKRKDNNTNNIVKEDRTDQIFDDSGFTTFQREQQILMSDSKEHTYDIQYYLDNTHKDNNDQMYQINKLTFAPDDDNVELIMKKNKPTVGKIPIVQSSESENQIYRSCLNDINEEDDNTINSNMYSIGGSPSESNNKMMIDMYDSKKGFWTQYTLNNESRCKFGIYPLKRDVLLIFGGISNNSTVPLSSSITIDLNIMTSKHHAFSLSSNRCAFTYTIVKDKLYIFGGHDGSEVLSISEEYDILSGKYRRLNDMKYKRDQPSCAYRDGFIYVVGGGGDNGESMKSVERYDIEKDVWDVGPNMLIGRRALSCVTCNNDIYSIGGYDGEKFLCSVEK